MAGATTGGTTGGGVVTGPGWATVAEGAVAGVATGGGDGSTNDAGDGAVVAVWASAVGARLANNNRLATAVRI